MDFTCIGIWIRHPHMLLSGLSGNYPWQWFMLAYLCLCLLAEHILLKWEVSIALGSLLLFSFLFTIVRSCLYLYTLFCYRSSYSQFSFVGIRTYLALIVVWLSCLHGFHLIYGLINYLDAKQSLYLICCFPSKQHNGNDNKKLDIEVFNITYFQSHYHLGITPTSYPPLCKEYARISFLLTRHFGRWDNREYPIIIQALCKENISWTYTT